MRHCRIRRIAPGPGAAALRPAQARVPRLRLRGHLGHRGRRHQGRASGRQPRSSRGRDRRPGRRCGGGCRAAGHDGHRPHALGDPRPRQRGERPPALRQRGSRPRRRQRNRRELHGAQGAVGRPWRRLHVADGRRGHRAPDRPSHGLRLARRGGAPGLQRARRSLRVRRDVPGRAGDTRRRPQGVPAHRRARRGRDLPGLRDPGVPARHARGAVHRERRDRRDHAGRHDLHGARRHADRPRGQAHRLGRGDRGEGRLRDVHAEGDLRAGRRARRDDRRPHGADRRCRSRRRGLLRRVDPGRHRPDRHRRVRDLVQCRV